MSQIEPEVILARLQAIRKYLQRLKQFESLTFEEYQNDFDTQLVTERLIQLCTEAALDINKYLFAKLGLITSKQELTNKEYFLNAIAHCILTQKTATALASAAGMRNILVHLYLDIENSQVFLAIEKCLQYYPVYMREILNYIDQLEEEND
jgi:uncharacterized protein YutE (UPF0331/DUF86 family)